jgi:hypothetical protein
VVIFLFPFLFFCFSFIIIYGFFVLSLKYPDTLGQNLVNFLKKNANKEIFTLVLLEPSSKNAKSFILASKNEKYP